MSRCIDLLLHIQKLGLLNSQEFPVELTKDLVSFLSLRACSFYTISSDQRNLILRGQNGFRYEEYLSFELPLDTIAGRAYKSQKIVVENGLADSDEYRDKKLIENHQLNEMIALPLGLVGEQGKAIETVGAVCIYPNPDRSLDFIDNLDILRQSIGLAYTNSVKKTKIQVREKVVTAISASTDINSALHRILHYSLRDQISIEASSVYLYDEKTRLLRLHATTGIDTKLHKRDIVYSQKDKGMVTWESFYTSKVISLQSINGRFQNDGHVETTRTPIKSLLVLPISRILQGKSYRKKKGALRVVNKLLRHGAKYELISFTKEDVEILSYVSEIIGLTSHMFLNKESRISYFEKIMHGTKSNIQTSIQNIDLLQRRDEIDRFLPTDLLYTVHDTREWLDDIKNQMERLENAQSEDLSIEPLNIAGDVLINAVRLFEKSAQTRGITTARITNLRAEGFFNLPKVLGNKKALMTVFRNLLENALKYRNHNNGNRCVIELSHEEDDNYVYIAVKDYGIGIPKGNERDIFYEGFRCENAVRQDPAGTGLGLTQSKEIMVGMGGDLTLVSRNPATLVVIIRRAN